MPDLFDNNAEQGVIGAILLAPESLHEIGELGAEDFYSQELKTLFSCCLTLWQRDDPIDSVSLLKEFERGVGPDVDTSAIALLIATIGSQTVTARNISADALSVRSFAVRRRARNVLRTILEELSDPAKPLLDVLDEARQLIEELNWLPSSSRMVLFREGTEMGGQDPTYQFNVIRPSDLQSMKITIKSAELDQPTEVRRIIREKMHLNPNLPPAEKWGAFVHTIVSQSTIADIPEALQVHGQLIFWVRAWFGMATLAEDPDDLNHGYVEKGDMYYIQPQRLVKWLDDHTKLKPNMALLWSMLETHGARRDVSVRIKKESRRLWGIPIAFIHPPTDAQLTLNSEEQISEDKAFLAEFEDV